MIRYSRRLDWSTPHNRLALLLDDKRRASGAGPRFDLTGANPTSVGLPWPEDALRAALASNQSAALIYRPDPQGLPDARHAIAAYYRERDLLVEDDDILACASTSEAYALLFKLLCDPGDVVLVPQPSYPLFDLLAALESVRLAPYPLVYDGEWRVDVAALQQAIADAPADRVRALVVVNPNNPTGSYLQRADHDALVALARAHHFALVSDEVFADYPLSTDRAGTRITSLVDERDATTFCLSGLSKVVGLPQLKLSWIVATGPGDERRRAMARLELIADTYLSVAAPVQLAAPALLALRPSLAGAVAARTRASLELLQRAVAGTACQVLRADGGWYAVVRVPATRTDEAWALALLDEDDVLVQPGYFYDFAGEAYLVVSLLTPEPVLREGIARLVQRVEHG